MVLIKMAWLNMWRNKRRAVILLMAVIVGLAGIIFMMGFMNGWKTSMIDRAIRTSEAHIKISTPEYQQNPVVENHMVMPEKLKAFLDGDPRVDAWTERATLSGLAQNARHSTMANIVGVDPSSEQQVSVVAESLIEGTFLDSVKRRPVLIGSQLKERGRTKLKRRVVLLSQQLGGELGSDSFRICGIFDSGESGLGENTVYVLKSDLQAMLALSNAITEVAVMLKDIDQSEAFQADVKALLKGADLVVLTWKELMPFEMKMFEMQDKTMIPFYMIFYLAMAFGILNTLLMAVGERTYEFGVMLAVGMARSRVMLMVLAESLFIALVASIVGAAVGLAIVSHYGSAGMDFSSFSEAMAYFNMGRVIYPFVGPVEVAMSVTATFIATIVFALYPAWRACRLHPVEALRHVG